MSVIKFYSRDAARNPDAVLEQAAGCYDKVLILGWDVDGKLDARVSTNLDRKEILWMIEGFKFDLFTATDDERSNE